MRQSPSPAAMDTPDFRVKLGFERSLRRDRPYGGYPRLPSEDSPQMAFFDAAFEGNLPRLRVERAPRRPILSPRRLAAPPPPFVAASHLLGFFLRVGNGMDWVLPLRNAAPPSMCLTSVLY
ncbi:hypothetical protein ZWY2020_054004 [Hordeum vulgare]|nr:hypothetical protein ZWY2020_054004 [Hordeum vulgare]